MTAEEQVGLVCYMRSIAPSSMGAVDFEGYLGPSRSGAAASAVAGGAAMGGGGAAATGATGGGGMGAPSVPCGAALCSNPPNDLISMITAQLAAACCADEATSACGTITSSGTCSTPPPAAPYCPSALGNQGCCAGGNHCGVDASQLGMGCVEIAQFEATLPAQLVTNLMLPAPAHCDGTPAPKADAGP